MQAPRPRRRHTAVAIKQALHTPTVNLPRTKPHSSTANPRGIPWRTPSCQTGQTGQTGQMQAPRQRNTHTAVAIKKARHTLRHICPPSHPKQRQANPRGIPRRPHTPLINLIVPTDLMQATHPRATHTTVAITLPQRYIFPPDI